MVEALITNICVPILVTLITYILTNLWYRPYEKLKELKVKTHCALILYADRINNPISLSEHKENNPNEYYIDAQKKLRNLGAEWMGFKEYKNFTNCFIINNNKCDNIGENLIGLSNSIIHNSDGFSVLENNEKMLSVIKKELKIKDIKY